MWWFRKPPKPPFARLHRIDGEQIDVYDRLVYAGREGRVHAWELSLTAMEMIEMYDGQCVLRTRVPERTAIHLMTSWT